MLITIQMQIVKLEPAMMQQHYTLQLIKNVKIILQNVNQMELVVLIFLMIVPL